MPYKSAKQRAYMHIHEPEVAAKWDAEYGGKVKGKKKGRIKKIDDEIIKRARKKELAAGLGVAALGGALANQIPPVQEVVRRKKKVKKSLEPVWFQKRDEDPYYNHEVAEKVFELVRKMDDDEAEMFAYFTACEMLDQDIQKNRRMLQRHVDDVVRKRLDGVKRAVTTISKRDGMNEDVLAYSQAIDRLEEIIKATPYDYGFRFQESQVRRNESGQFATEIKVSADAKPWTDQQMSAMGHDGANKRIKALKKEAGTPKTMSPKARAQFQQEYTQLANFLQTFKQSGGDSGDDKVLVHVENKRTGTRYTVPAKSGGKVPDVWDPRTERVVGVEARPVQANMAGASYNLGQALGGSAEQSRKAAFYGERLDQNIKPFAENWTMAAPGESLNTNARTYGRVQTGAGFVGAITPPNSAVHNAARLAQFAGQHGPEAEKVFGPAARKTAYRYRGTEKTPDSNIVTLYERAVNQTKLSAPQDRGQGPAETGRKARVSGQPAEVPAVSQIAAAAQTARERVPTWSERDLGRRVIMEQLGFQIPNRHLYGLNLAAGNTPPSEGILLNKDGQIVTQAVGYGDDHYLPFNLKNLKALKGGEYIRTRSVGGPTSEDIYTGLLTGARQVTVISRSGTFTLTFDETLRGGRRYNDKAMRMTDRYEHLLDAVESEQVDARPVPDYVKNRIQGEIERDYGDWSAGEQKKMYRQKEEEYKAFGTGLTKEDKNYIDSRVQLEMDRDPRGDARRLKSELTAQALSEKEFKFRLNGEGYAAALDALQEQFPYYIKVNSKPRRDLHISEPEKDKGYVMPRHNRPAGAKHGYFNPRIAGEGQIAYEGERAGQMTGKVKASEADYQNLAHAGKAVREPGEKKAEEPTSTTPTGGEVGGPIGEGGAPTNQGGTAEEKTVREVRERFRDNKDVDEISEKAWALLQANPTGQKFDAQNPLSAMATAGDRAAFDARVKTPEGRAELHAMIQNAPLPGFRQVPAAYAAYVDAYMKVDRKTFSEAESFTWTEKPMKFTDDVHKKTADPTLLENRIKDLNAHSQAVSSTKGYREMSDLEKKAELAALRSLSTERETYKGLSASGQKKVFEDYGFGNPSNAAKLINAKDAEKAIQKQARMLQEIRLLQHNQDAQLKSGPGASVTDTTPTTRPGGGEGAGQGGGGTPPANFNPPEASQEAKENAEREAGGPITNVGTKQPTPAEQRVINMKAMAMGLHNRAEDLAAFPDAAAVVRRHAEVLDKILEQQDKGAAFHTDRLDELEQGGAFLQTATPEEITEQF